VNGSVLLQPSGGVGDGVPARDLATALRVAGYNRLPNRVNLRVQTVDAVLEQVEPIERPQLQDDDNDQNRGSQGVASSFLFRSSLASAA
jgi:hypothetical protein